MSCTCVYKEQLNSVSSGAVGHIKTVVCSECLNKMEQEEIINEAQRQSEKAVKLQEQLIDLSVKLNKANQLNLADRVKDIEEKINKIKLELAIR
jgi:hypothetical protein